MIEYKSMWRKKYMTNTLFNTKWVFNCFTEPPKNEIYSQISCSWSFILYLECFQVEKKYKIQKKIITVHEAFYSNQKWSTNYQWQSKSNGIKVKSLKDQLYRSLAISVHDMNIRKCIWCLELRRCVCIICHIICLRNPHLATPWNSISYRENSSQGYFFYVVQQQKTSHYLLEILV